MGWEWYELVWKHLKQPTFSLKIVEVVVSFVILVIHRAGENGQLVAFSQTAVDANVIGVGACVGFLVITLALLMAHFLDKVDARRPFLEMVLAGVAAGLFLMAGSLAVDYWRQVDLPETGSVIADAVDGLAAAAGDAVDVYGAENAATKITRWTPHSNRSSGLAMGSLSILLSFVYAAHVYCAWKDLHDPGNLPS